MNWLLWRQHRAQTLVSATGLALFAIVVWITGVTMANDYTSAVHSCSANGTCDLIGGLFQGDGAIVDLVHLSIALPVLLGVFLGATLVARETEHATNVLIWTQTVTRRRWLLTNVAVVVAATVLVATVVSALVTWWSHTPNALYGNRFDGTQFDTQNLVPIAYALFAVALGIAAGCFLRRTLPALAATVGLYVGLRVAVAVYLRPRYLPSSTRSFALAGDAKLPPGSWTLSSHLVDPTGRALPNGRLDIPAGCHAAGSRGAMTDCLNRLGYRQVVTYQPPSHYWHFQWIEAALFTAVAAALFVAAVITTLRHDA
jgi:hypothetical protein